MYLKALEIQGFKSFPDKTRLTFEKDITAIVGPNGSGKSNISDALLWVMGEQRSKALRGGKMEDVIFGGTEKRSPMGFAQVSLVLDNTAGLFDVDTPEVVITRRYYRTGESEYYLNRESVRLRDITELLMDTGLGRDGYSVIGQGRIAEIVSAKSTDRREVFEEAAGIARYRRRKEEAERKLEGTSDNLLRINDKIDELEMQVTPLKQQAETAKKYLVLRDEQRVLEISVWMETLDRLHEQAEQVGRDFENAKQQLNKAQSELNRIYEDSENYSEKMRECDVSAESMRTRRSESESASAELESRIAVLRANLAHNNDTIGRMSGEMSEQADRARGLESQIRSHGARLAQIGLERAETERAISDALRETEENAALTGETQKEIAELIRDENALNEELTHSQTVAAMLADTLTGLEERKKSIDADIAACEEKYETASKQLHELEKELSAKKERFDEINNIISGHKMRMDGREKKVGELTDELNRLTVDKRSAESRINLLSELEKDFEGLGKAVKNVMREKSRGALRGVYEPVAGLLSVDNRYAVAIETALGASMQNVVVDTPECGKAVIDMLKRSDGGRVTCMPISSTRPFSLSRRPEGEEGYLGVASELIRFDAKFENIFLNLLGRTVITETLGDAVRLAKKYNNQFRIVSLDGQVMNVGGSMTGGSAARNVGILSRANELKALREKQKALESGERACADRLSQAQRELTAAKYELSVAQDELQSASDELHLCRDRVGQCRLLRGAADESLESLENEKTGLSSQIEENKKRAESASKQAEKARRELERIKEKINEASSGRGEFEKRRDALSVRISEKRAAAASLEAERDATERSMASLKQLLAAISGDGEQRRKNIEEIKRQNTETEAELDEKAVLLAQRQQRTRELSEKIDGINAQRLALEGKRTACEKSLQDKNRELLDMQSVCAKFEQKKLSSEMEENQIVDKLWESYELSRSAAQEARQRVENMAASTKRIAELKREISRLGSVNIGAIEEYERVSERYGFLTAQRDDVAGAKRELEKIIADLTAEMREIFISKFRAIDESFRKVFLDLFGGGRASLELEDEANVLECGIEIKVQPPGKAVTTISLLSGGEKSFVAIALYFAIMKVRPTPFCIMDEIDAALDEANVNRYAEYMRLMSDHTQFIAITHHRGTMEEADILYGVTMQEKGVTTVLSIDLDEAEKNIV